MNEERSTRVFSHPPVFTSNQAIADYHVSGSTPFALGHYPSDAIFPGVMSLHFMKLLSDQFFEYLTDTESRVVHLKRITYLDLIRPGDIISISCRLKKRDIKEMHIQSFIRVNNVIMSKSTFLYKQ
jgi:3-hydroxymyristoyl/3-hydroxydecanoyl-(acyl carrier protein) dehydratase